jgi:DNA-binding beta-propeller fold protein YncE
MVFVGAASGLLGDCGPFTDFTDAGFCPFVLEIFYLGITTGTTPTTYEPGSNVSRLQMAAFLSRSVDRALGRGSRRAALDQFWTTKVEANLGLTTVDARPQLVKSDGLDLWVASFDGNSVSHVRGTDGKLLETWTGATAASGVLVAMGRVFVTGALSFPAPGNLYRIDPTQPAGAVTTVASNLGLFPIGLDFDGARIWTANADNVAGSVSIVTPGASIPWTVTTVTTGFKSPIGVVYDGASVWVTDFNPPRLFKLDSAGAILQTVTVGFQPRYPVYDGTNIWVPNEGSDTITVVRAGSGVILQTLTGNGLNGPLAAAFDGQRVLVTNLLGDSVSLWKAADLTPLGFFPTGTNTKPVGACSDGIDFWITLSTVNQIARF